MAGSGLLFEGGQVNNASIAAAIASLDASVSALQAGGGFPGGLPLLNVALDSVAALDGNDNIFLQGYDGSDVAQGTYEFDADGKAYIGLTLETQGHVGVGTAPDYDHIYSATGYYGINNYLAPTDAAALNTAYSNATVAGLYTLFDPSGLDGVFAGDILGEYVFLGNDSVAATQNIDGGLIGGNWYVSWGADGKTIKNVDGLQMFAEAWGGAQVTQAEARLLGASFYVRTRDAGTAVTNMYATQVTAVVGAGTTVDNLWGIKVFDVSGGTRSRAIETGTGIVQFGDSVIIGSNAAPADGDLAAGQMAIWFDDTDGAAKFMVKAKQADGTVKTGSFNVQT